MAVRSNMPRVRTPLLSRGPRATPVERLGRLGLAVVWVLAEGLMFLDGVTTREKASPDA